jgi:hypothetical protein
MFFFQCLDIISVNTAIGIGTPFVGEINSLHRSVRQDTLHIVNQAWP